MSSVTIISGGMDSVTLAYYLRDLGYNKQTLLSFDYGQRHKKELQCASLIAKELHAEHHIIYLTSVTPLLRGSSQTDSSVAVPEGHYAEETMKLTVVPNRNAIMLSIAYGVAVAKEAEALFYGAHAGDHAVYPDCRLSFVQSFANAMHIGNEGFGDPNLQVLAPFIALSKSDIVKLGIKIGVPYAQTWTCYKGGAIACGRCSTCCERLEAFAANEVEDPIEYMDREYWKMAVANFKSKII